jgi:Fe-Mn family superoxide dismutase
MQHTLPQLNYSYQALEPYFDRATMEIHYTKHHQAYVDNLNKVLAKYPNYQSQELVELMKNFQSLSMEAADKTAFKNHGGGHLNHSFFWSILGPKKELDRELMVQIEKEYRSLGEFRALFSQTAVSHFGSGWAWLVRDKLGKLQIYSTPNQDSPMLNGDTPLIGLDLWEHAYYLKYQNRRAEYIQAWWQTLKLI